MDKPEGFCPCPPEQFRALPPYGNLVICLCCGKSEDYSAIEIKVLSPVINRCSHLVTAPNYPEVRT